MLQTSHGYISAIISGKFTKKIFKSEIGKHCVQRVPPTESKGRRQTSMLSVSVLPIIESKGLTFDEGDVTIETYNAGGKGGQHQNKTDSAVRVKHNRTGIVVSINGRHQHKNKIDALKILQSKVAELDQSIIDKERQDSKREQVENIGRGNKVRTYNFIDSRVVDHNTNKMTRQINKVMKGRFDLIR